MSPSHPLRQGGHILLSVEHRTHFAYSDAVSLSHNEIRMSPIETGLQRVLQHAITVSPEVPLSSHRDHFGNLVHHCNILEPHTSLDIHARSVVETTNALSCGPEPVPVWRLTEMAATRTGVPCATTKVTSTASLAVSSATS